MWQADYRSLCSVGGNEDEKVKAIMKGTEYETNTK